MTPRSRATLLIAVIAALFLIEGLTVSWNSSLSILNMALISAVMALGVNMQWGYAGLFNVGIVGFVALGGLAPVLISTEPVAEAWSAGGWRIPLALLVGAASVALAVWVNGRTTGRTRALAILGIVVAGFAAYRAIFDPAVAAVEAFDPATHGNLGGLGLPVLLAWPVGGLLAAGAAWLIGKTALGLRSDYL
ncbi:MAG: hypothetical protein RLZZ528_1742, partial [Pseudomonadota bacterium]